MPEDSRGVCDACKGGKQHSVVPREDIKSHSTAYDDVLDGLRKGTRWQRIRHSVMQRDPACKRCGLHVSEICDHKVPAAIAIQQAQDSGRYPLDKYAGYYLKSNLQGMCRPCHGMKTIEDKTHTGPWPDVIAAEAAAPRKVWTF